MSLVASSPLSRGQRSPFPPFLTTEHDQQVPGSPLSPFFLAGAGSGGGRGPCSPSSGSPLAQVPERATPLLRHLLASGRKRRRDEGGSPSPSPSSSGVPSRRDSPRVPNSIIIVRRTAATNSKTKGDQEVPSPLDPIKTGATQGEGEAAGSGRSLPEVSENTKTLDLFGETAEIFASRREE